MEFFDGIKITKKIIKLFEKRIIKLKSLLTIYNLNNECCHLSWRIEEYIMDVG